jgi:hypothetical protein
MQDRDEISQALFYCVALLAILFELAALLVGNIFLIKWLLVKTFW